MSACAGTHWDATSPLTVHHFGPDPAYVGGMSRVINVLAEHRVGADIVVTHPTWRPKSRFASLPLALRAACGLFRTGKSDVIHVHMAEKGAVLREGSIAILARLLRRATVITIHGGEFLPTVRAHPHFTSVVLKSAQVITCLQTDVLQAVQQTAPRARVVLISNPVSMDHGSPSAAETEEIVLFAGVICLTKGVDVLQRAWPQVANARPKAQCIMVGPADDFTVPTTERLDVRPAVDANAMRALLRSARVVVLPSRTEAMPMILTEAMSAARPFVSTPVGGIPELAQEGGVLVAVEDEDALAAHLIAFLANPQLAGEVGEAGQQFCARTRSVEVVGAQLRELYQAASGSA